MSIPLDIPPFGNQLGLFALAAYITTLLPSIFRVVFPAIKKTKLPKLLLKYRRVIGILAFIFALGHAYLVIRKRNFDFFDPETYIVSFEGTTTLIVFTLLAITSNDWSIKRLKRNWKRLHTLTYLAMFLLTWHVLSKMSGQWTWITPWAAIAILTTVVLFAVRKWTEIRLKQQQKNLKIKPQ